MPRPPFRVLAALAVGIALACTTSVNPTTGRRDVVLMSAADEQRIDEEAAREIAANVGLVKDADLARYVEELGQKLAEHSPRQDVPYRFRILEADEPNAFALPGGHVYLSRGLLVLANTEAEIAHVLGHEIGHVAARHIAQRDAHMKTLGLATLLGNLMSGGGERTSEAEKGASHPLARYAREQERQADRIGQEIARLSGIEPGGMARFLVSLDNYTKLSQGFSMPQTYFSTHPATRERIVDAATRAQTQVLRGGGPGADAALDAQRADRDAYLDRIDGMTVSRPASEGVFVEDRFLHADLGFSVRFPHDWATRNEPARVVAVAPDRDGLVLLELQGPGRDPVSAAREFAEQQQLALQRGTPVRIGELSGFRASSQVMTEAGPLDAEITWVAFDGRIYRLVGGMRGGRGAKYQGQYRKFAQSFRALDAETAATITERRLRTPPVRPGETLATFSTRTGNQWDLTQTAVVNGIFASDALEPGQRLKVAVDEAYQAQPVPLPEAAAAD